MPQRPVLSKPTNGLHTHIARPAFDPVASLARRPPKPFGRGVLAEPSRFICRGVPAAWGSPQGASANSPRATPGVPLRVISNGYGRDDLRKHFAFAREIDCHFLRTLRHACRHRFSARPAHDYLCRQLWGRQHLHVAVL